MGGGRNGNVRTFLLCLQRQRHACTDTHVWELVLTFYPWLREVWRVDVCDAGEPGTSILPMYLRLQSPNLEVVLPLVSNGLFFVRPTNPNDSPNPLAAVWPSGKVDFGAPPPNLKVLSPATEEEASRGIGNWMISWSRFSAIVRNKYERKLVIELMMDGTTTFDGYHGRIVYLRLHFPRDYRTIAPASPSPRGEFGPRNWILVDAVQVL
eukprot:TRINITY_DN41174_c0_g1_i1.p1 TRINITY_DN41174_c0_g1~~TRINITY_DN41174_c0_g1_i1.p1  ORF type:complete len:209 (+),score=27.38 TRINITY_DN41174_c0_g1_i1:30-656(+)